MLEDVDRRVRQPLGLRFAMAGVALAGLLAILRSADRARASGMHRRARLGWRVLCAAAVLAAPVSAAERELDRDPAPSSAREIQTPLERVLPEEPERPRVFPWLRRQLQDLPPFFADSQLEARFRTYFLRQDRTTDQLSYAWAAGGSISFRSGWLADRFQVEVEGFTSQRIHGPADRGGTLLLAPVQQGYSVLGIANAKLRYKGLVLTGYRQYLDLPYVNRQDNRMTPNTFESITLAKPEGKLRFSTGYAWKIKLRNSDRFLSFTEAIGLEKDRGAAHGGAVWRPSDDFHIGAIAGVIPDVLAGLYAELGVRRDLAGGLEGRFDGQFSYRMDIGDDLLDDELDDTWNVGLRTSASRSGLVFRLGFSITGSNAPIQSRFGTNPSYLDLMQVTFNRANEKAVLASLSYDLSGLGVEGLSVIANFAAGFDAEGPDVRGDAREVDLTLDWRVKQGRLRGFWLRLRGSWLSEESVGRDGTDLRVTLRYDFPVI